jgi:hypothetical protein
MFRVGIWLGLASIAAAQGVNPQAAPTPLALLEQEAEKRTVEWTTLASGLEVRLARLLPCDARVREAVDEVSRASEARLTAWNGYWQSVAVKSRDQEAAARKLLASEEVRSAEWNQSRLDAEAERAATEAQAAVLAASTRTLPAMAGAQRTLDAVIQLSKQTATQAGEREATGLRLTDELRDLANRAQARQKNIDAQVKALATEANAWRTYYAARIARAQTECSITDPAAAAAVAPPAAPSKRPATRRKKQQ